MVIGTTGFDARAAERDPRRGAATIPIVMAPNLSVGVNVVFKLVEIAARVLGPDYDVEVFEVHHRHKVDAPSGTALKLGEVAAAARGATLEQGRRLRPPRRHRRAQGRQHRLLAPSRGGDIVGDHTVIFAGTGERIEITHRSHEPRDLRAGRAARGAVPARASTPGLYDMQDVLGLSSQRGCRPRLL